MTNKVNVIQSLNPFLNLKRIPPPKPIAKIGPNENNGEMLIQQYGEIILK